MTLATAPQVLLLDEPLAGMGTAEAERMVGLLQRLKDSHAILLVEHDMDAVFALADRLTVMVNGQVIATGTPARDPQRCRRAGRLPGRGALTWPTGAAHRRQGLHTYYGQSHILRGIDFQVARGETIGLMGRNGMGKSTLLKTLMGLVKPRGGSVTIMGKDMTGRPTYEIAQLGVAYVPEGRGIFGNLSVVENLKMAARPARAGSATGHTSACWRPSRACRNACRTAASNCRAASSRCSPSAAR
jgi:branched-chain amino acid transport system ATP-binding protein